jgi:hypothetical protein
MWVNTTEKVTTVSGRLNVTGQSCASSFCNLSDGRLKTDLAAVDEPLERLARLRAVSFRWDPAAGAVTDRGIGVVAQDVAEVFPDLVSTMGPDEHLGVDYSGLTAVLLDGVNALAAENRALRERVAALESR